MGAGIYIAGANSSGNAYARRISIRNNNISNVALQGMYLDQVQEMVVARNLIRDGATEGIRMFSTNGFIQVDENDIRDHTDWGIRFLATANQVGTLSIRGNIINGLTVGSGIRVGELAGCHILGNKLVSVSTGIAVGDITGGIKIRGNELITAATPFTLGGGSTQVGMDFGDNYLTEMDVVQDLTVAATAVAVTGPFHTITSVGATDLDNIGGPGRKGMVVALLAAPGTATITAKDGTGDMNLAGDYAMSADDVLWLAYDGTTWNEISRQ